MNASRSSLYQSAMRHDPGAGAGAQTDADGRRCPVGPDHVPRPHPDDRLFSATCHP